jgi:curli biogenesis system outer membrane secretion channel CsgG
MHARHRIFVLLAAVALVAATPAFGTDPRSGADVPGAASVDRASRPVVAIYEFRSGVSEIGARAATDMFVSALVRSGRFRVVERSRLNEGVVREKQLNANGLATGDVGGTQLQGARFLFERALSQANASEDQHASGVGIGGMEIGGGSNRDVLAIDVRVVDASNGEVLDVVTVTRKVDATSSSFSGVGNLLSAVAGARGYGVPVVPDVHVQQQHRESVDSAVRSAIEEAVARLGERFAK